MGPEVIHILIGDLQGESWASVQGPLVFRQLAPALLQWPIALCSQSSSHSPSDSLPTFCTLWLHPGCLLFLSTPSSNIYVLQPYSCLQFSFPLSSPNLGIQLPWIPGTLDASYPAFLGASLCSPTLLTAPGQILGWGLRTCHPPTQSGHSLKISPACPFFSNCMATVGLCQTTINAAEEMRRASSSSPCTPFPRPLLPYDT